LRALIDAGYDIAALVVAQNESGKSRKGRELEIVDVANKHGIPVLSPAKLSEAVDELKDCKADAAVLVAYGKIVPQNVIDIFPQGIINIHPSLLPLHRGPTPIESVMVNGDDKTGVSLMRLAAEMDAGPVYAQETIELDGTEAKKDLADKLIELGKDMLLEHLPAILDGLLQPEDQDDTKATYDTKVEKADGDLVYANESAVRLERKVRAFAGWPKARAKIGAKEIIVISAHVEDFNGVAGTLWLEGKQIGLHCTEGVLVLDRVMPPGKKEMDASSFLAGYKL
jgi:methionyl-tRNA formyltransferase